MTSWERGKQNEQQGQMEERDGANRGDLGEQVRGAAKDVAGKVEQSVDNLGDTLTGKQKDLEGNDRNVGREAQTWVEHRADDAQDAANKAGNWVQDRADDVNRKV